VEGLVGWEDEVVGGDGWSASIAPRAGNAGIAPDGSRWVHRGRVVLGLLLLDVDAAQDRRSLSPGLSLAFRETNVDLASRDVVFSRPARGPARVAARVRSRGTRATPQPTSTSPGCSLPAPSTSAAPRRARRVRGAVAARRSSTSLEYCAVHCRCECREAHFGIIGTLMGKATGVAPGCVDAHKAVRGAPEVADSRPGRRRPVRRAGGPGARAAASTPRRHTSRGRPATARRCRSTRCPARTRRTPRNARSAPRSRALAVEVPRAAADGRQGVEHRRQGARKPSEPLPVAFEDANPPPQILGSRLRPLVRAGGARSPPPSRARARRRRRRRPRAARSSTAAAGRRGRGARVRRRRRTIASGESVSSVNRRRRTRAPRTSRSAADDGAGPAPPAEAR